MIKLLMLFKKPLDTDAFLQQYYRGFLPIAKKLPGLQSLVSNRVKGEVGGGEPTYFIVCELHFATKESLKGAVQSAPYRNLGAVMAVFAKGLVTVLATEVVKPPRQSKTVQLSEFEELTL